jgi:hypothetical protein
MPLVWDNVAKPSEDTRRVKTAAHDPAILDLYQLLRLHRSQGRNSTLAGAAPETERKHVFLLFTRCLVASSSAMGLPWANPNG